MKQTLTCDSCDARVDSKRRSSTKKGKASNREKKKNVAKPGVDVGAMPREMTPAARTWNPGQVRLFGVGDLNAMMLHGPVYDMHVTA